MGRVATYCAIRSGRAAPIPDTPPPGSENLSEATNCVSPKRVSGLGVLFVAKVTLHLIEQLRAEGGELWGTSSKLYRRIDELLRELADPHLEDIPTRLPFRVEMWDRSDIMAILVIREHHT